jgi:hypothetical protein
MPIKNYTSAVDAFKSVGEIQGALAKAGASKMIIDYNAGVPTGLTFAMLSNRKFVGFLLPANIEGVSAVFAQQKVRADQEQVIRTAWRNVRDWVLAQLALVEAGNAEFKQVFLPYLTDGRGNTMYSLYQSGQLALPEVTGYE